MAEQQLSKSIIPKQFRRSSPRQWRLATAEDSGFELLELMRNRLSLTDYSNSSILDIGCGTRIPAAIFDRKILVRKYVGMDVDKELIDFLQTHFTDDPYDFHHLDIRNDLYNPSGRDLTLDRRLPLQDSFDVICLFSVFTHLNPQDSDCMLSILHRYIRDTGRLIFTCFIDDSVSGFDDRDHEKPLLMATYTESFFRHLIHRNGWHVEALYPPTKAKKDYWLMQHCFVCTPD